MVVGGGLNITAAGLVLEGRVMFDQRFSNRPAMTVVVGYGMAN